MYIMHTTTQDIENLILLSKSPSPLNPIPLPSMKKISPLLAKYIYEIIYTSIMKASLYTKIFVSYCHSKKSYPFDTNSLCNYIPISQLSTISKIIEIVVFNKLINYLNNNYLIDSNPIV